MTRVDSGVSILQNRHFIRNETNFTNLLTIIDNLNVTQIGDIWFSVFWQLVSIYWGYNHSIPQQQLVEFAVNSSNWFVKITQKALPKGPANQNWYQFPSTISCAHNFLGLWGRVWHLVSRLLGIETCLNFLRVSVLVSKILVSKKSLGIGLENI